MKKSLVAVLITLLFFINLFSYTKVHALQNAPVKSLFAVKPKGNYIEILKGSQVIAKILPPELLNEPSTKRQEVQTIVLPFFENGTVNWKFEKSEPSDLLFLSDGKNNTLKINFHTLDAFYKITSPNIALKDQYQSAQLAFNYNCTFKKPPQLKDDETINVQISIFSENKSKILVLPEKIKVTSGKGTFKTSFSIPVDSRYISFEIFQTSHNLISCEFENFKITFIKPSKYPLLLKNVQVYNNYIEQEFENGFQRFTRKIFVSSSQDVINVEESLKSKEDHQVFKEYSVVEFESKPIFILKRDYKLEKFTKPMYVTDSLSDFYLRLENCAIGYANNYDSIEAYNIKNKANVYMFLSNSDDIKYFVIGKNREHIYTTTQLFRKGFEKTYAYSIFPAEYTYSIKSRTPNGTKAILIFSHHSDSNMISIIKAMMFGTTDAKDPTYMKKGFVGYKIPITWGFFYKSVKGIPGFDNPEYRNLIEFLAQNKIEVVLHTASPVAKENTVELIKKALEDTSYLKLDDWIDHSLSDGTRNAALKSEGAIHGSKNYSFDLFLKHGYKYCWSYLDVKLDTLNMLQPDKVTWHPQIFFKNYNFGEGNSLYQWNSVRFKNLPKIISQSQLNKLVNENGVCIIHDYFAHPMQKNKLFVVKNKNVYISPQFDKSLRLVANLMSKKLLWVPTVKEFIDYEVALKNVQITPLDSTTLVIDNKNYSEIKGFTLIALLQNGQEKRIIIDLLPGINLITVH